ncbi:unnamed protein product [Protopolystoma xenopodis]|uniref:ABC transporter domain-containing protein n=1 Tax=Protopolystoma xenopodis TaxID=117903 RepID=A0A3S4ZRR8_9PLAT|nr:unnamed protein product [Protopolystoma xenopodis]
MSLLDFIDSFAVFLHDFLSGCVRIDDKFIGFHDELAFYHLLEEYKERFVSVIGVIFDQAPQSLDMLQLNQSIIKIRMRLPSSTIDETLYFRVLDRYWTPDPRNRPSVDMKYFTSGFIDAQELISDAIISLLSDQPKEEDREATSLDLFSRPITATEMKLFPTPCYTSDLFIRFFLNTLPLFLVLSWICTFVVTVKSIVYEKEYRLKEFTKVMGLSNFIHWANWFTFSFLAMSISSIIISLLLKFGGVLPRSDLSLLLFFVSSYAVAIIYQAFLFSVFFSRAHMSAMVSGLFYLLFYIPALVIMLNEHDFNVWGLGALSLAVQVPYSLGWIRFSRIELQGRGATWSDLRSNELLEDIFPLGSCLLLIWIDILIYSLLTWYIEAVFPGKYGIAQPFYFPFRKSYWFGLQGPEDLSISSSSTYPVRNPITRERDFAVDSETVQNWMRTKASSLATFFKSGFWFKNSPFHLSEDLFATSDTSEVQGYFEAEPTHLPIGVAIDCLTMAYTSRARPAIRGLTLNFYEGQVTSFLGHNGAGKTTTISILTGLYPPTSGTAFINGLDIRKHMSTIRNSIGLCPQHNVLFDDLTVSEHIYFYASLKSLENQDISREADRLLSELGFFDKRHDLVRNLSGGQKRKLSVALAFVGNSRLIFLDEPTAGVDPYSRRSIWDLVLRAKSHRTIILTTHHMDEADILGDRIAVISQGELRCCGSSLFLKEHYGSGYYLVMAKCQSHARKSSLKMPVEAESRATTSSRLLIFIRSFVIGARLVLDMPTEVTFSLPLSGTLNGSFVRLFNALETGGTTLLNDLGISSYGLSDTILEEIFLLVANDPSSRTSSKAVDNVAFEYDSDRQSEDCIDSKYTHSFQDLNCPKVLSHDFPFDNGDFIKASFPSCSTLRATSVPDASRRAKISRGLDSLTDGGKFPRVATHWSLMRNNLHRLVHKRRSTPVLKPLTFPGSTIFEGGLSSRSSSSDLFRQAIAVTIKRFHHVRRNKKGWFVEIILPVSLIIVVLLAIRTFTVFTDQPSMQLNPWLLAMINSRPQLTVFYENAAFAHKEPEYSEQTRPVQVVGQLYETALQQPVMFTGLRCVPRDRFLFEPEELGVCDFKIPDTPPMLNTSQRALARENSAHTCQCHDGTISGCSLEPNPPSMRLASTDELINLTGYSVPNYLLKSSSRFLMRRYGGFSFQPHDDLSMRGHLEQALSENSTLVDLLAQLTGEVGHPDIFWTKFFRTLRLMLPPSHYHRIWFNNKGYLSAPGYLNMMHNMKLRLFTRARLVGQFPGGARDLGLSISNHPLNYTQAEVDKQKSKALVIDFTLAIFVILALSFIPANFILFLVQERFSGAKHLQFVSGLHPCVYWLTTYAWDIINYCFPALLCVAIFAAFDKQSYVGSGNIVPFTLLLLLYGVAIIPLMYPFSFLFSVPSTAFVCLAMLNLLIGVLGTLTTFMLDMFSLSDPYLKEVNNVLKRTFLIFPQYCLGRGIYNLAERQIMLEQNLPVIDSPLDRDVTLLHIIFLPIHAVLFFIFTLLIEYSFFWGHLSRFLIYKFDWYRRWSQSRLERRLKGVVPPQDPDVRQEMQRVLQVAFDNELLES